MKVKINVTEDDIEHGIKSDCRKCPIALAINTHLADGYIVAVNMTDVFIQRSSNLLSFLHVARLPLTACRFIHKFDCYLAHTPFDFYLDIPDTYLNSESRMRNAPEEPRNA